MIKTLSTLAVLGALVIGGTAAASAQARHRDTDTVAAPSWNSEGRSSAVERPESFDVFPGESRETGAQDGIGENPQGIGG